MLRIYFNNFIILSFDAILGSRFAACLSPNYQNQSNRAYVRSSGFNHRIKKVYYQ